MAPKDHEKLRRLFDQVLDAPSEDRGALLDRLADGDADLRLRLAAMVKGWRQGGGKAENLEARLKAIAEEFIADVRKW